VSGRRHPFFSVGFPIFVCPPALLFQYPVSLRDEAIRVLTRDLNEDGSLFHSRHSRKLLRRMQIIPVHHLPSLQPPITPHNPLAASSEQVLRSSPLLPFSMGALSNFRTIFCQSRSSPKLRSHRLATWTPLEIFSPFQFPSLMCHTPYDPYPLEQGRCSEHIEPPLFLNPESSSTLIRRSQFHLGRLPLR